ncbi:SPW repeat domain-containing protein [Adhaeribacter radiodurans]|uniref:SPW repeat protein n=1 Tax=Adhaeribacter radiodurans TaxID=2745197 RepID=A0A7L7LCR5_9BACT|nr:SPW repeat protein [Adhaeribacter radiodurans]QMU30335.1 SPW repeat protein [Adhaeribacter radiodurans]
MRIIPTRIHGILDYLVGIILIAAPWVFDFDNGGAETWVPVIVGIMVLLQTIMTDFEVGIIRKIPMASHLRMDFFIGLFLAASPWIFNFDEVVWAPHVIFGVFSILASLMTRRVPSTVASTSRSSIVNDMNNNRL